MVTGSGQEERPSLLEGKKERERINDSTDGLNKIYCWGMLLYINGQNEGESEEEELINIIVVIAS